MTFTDMQQKEHRKVFIAECRQKAWGAACHADFIAAGLDQLLDHFKKLQEEDRTLEADLKELQKAPDYHTVDNRNKQKAINEKRAELAKRIELVQASAREGQKVLADNLQAIDLNLRLAAHAETWEHKEPEKPKETEAKKEA